MPSIFLTLLAVLVVSIGARDQMLVARLSHQLGGSWGLLAAGWLSAALTAAIMAAAGTAIAGMMPPAGKQMLIAIAIAFAAIELGWNRKKDAPAEPTRSLFAIFAVLFARQFGDAARFLIFALSIAAGSAWLAGLGGALGGIAAVTAGWMMADDLSNSRGLRIFRILLGAALLVLAIYVALLARGLIA